MEDAWGFIWIMLVLKIPLAGLLWIVWWAIHEVDDPAAEDGGPGGDGGSKVPPRPRRPRRRGPHGDAPPLPPARVRAPEPPREHESA